MAVLRLKVRCSSCNLEVLESNARRVPSVTKEPRYQCFLCFKRHQPINWGFGDEVYEKKKFYCERCNFKFRAKQNKCPYCGKSDRLVQGKITVRDLI